jgi:hypothetical protein
MYSITPRGRGIIERGNPGPHEVFELAQFMVAFQIISREASMPMSQPHIVKVFREMLGYYWVAPVQLQATQVVLDKTEAVLTAACDRGWIQCMASPDCK